VSDSYGLDKDDLREYLTQKLTLERAVNALAEILAASQEDMKDLEAQAAKAFPKPVEGGEVVQVLCQACVSICMDYLHAAGYEPRQNHLDWPGWYIGLHGREAEDIEALNSNPKAFKMHDTFGAMLMSLDWDLIKASCPERPARGWGGQIFGADSDD
jgi:hypothetical protein